MINLRTHNILDYVAGVALLFIPAIAGFSAIDSARNFFILGGMALIVYSALTNYRYSVARVIPLGVHMALDTILGVCVAAAPWIFGYRALLTSGQEALHYILGAGVCVLVAMTRPKTEAQKGVGGATVYEYTSTENRRAG